MLQNTRIDSKKLTPANKIFIKKFEDSLQQLDGLAIRKSSQQIEKDDLHLLRDKLRAELQDDQVKEEGEEGEEEIPELAQDS